MDHDNETPCVDLLPVIGMVSTIEDVQSALDDPEAFAKKLLATVVGPAAKKLLIGQLRPRLEPTLMKLQGISWAQALPALERIDDLMVLDAGLRDPAALVGQLAAELH